MELASKGGSIIWEFKKFLAIVGLEEAIIHGLCEKYIRQGSVLWRDMLDDLQNQAMNPERLSIADALFARLVQNGQQTVENIPDGCIPLKNLIGCMVPPMHPDVRNGLKDEFGVMLEVLESFKGLKNVGFSDFSYYLKMVSICIDEDKEFTKYCTELWAI